MDAPDVIYEQEFTLNELRDIGESGLILSNQKSKMTFDNLTFSLNEIDLENVDVGKPTTYHYAIQNNEESFGRSITIGDADDEKEGTELEMEELEEEMLSSLPSLPLPRNKQSHNDADIRNRIKYQPSISPCNACFHGLHDRASCGISKKFDVSF